MASRIAKQNGSVSGRGGSGPDDQVAYARAVQEAQFNEELLTGGQEIREHIIEEMNERELSKGWAKDRLDKARLFCEYLVKNAYLGVLPRAIDRHWSRIGKGFSIVSRELTASVDKVLTKEKNEEPTGTVSGRRGHRYYTTAKLAKLDMTTKPVEEFKIPADPLERLVLERVRSRSSARCPRSAMTSRPSSPSGRRSGVGGMPRCSNSS